MKTADELMAEIEAAYAELDADRKNGGMGQGFIEDRIAALWRQHDKAKEEAR